MGYAFLSYSTQNQEFADAMNKYLNDNGIDTWMAPGDIPVGKEYAAVITNAVRDCSCLVLLLSQASQKSKWVSREVERAVNYGKTIIPIQLESMHLNEEFEIYIGKLHIVSVNDINSNDVELKKALKCIATCVGYTYTDFSAADFDAQIGQTILFGKFHQSNSSGFSESPLEWKVLAKDNDKLLLLSNRCIDVKAFDQSINSLQKATPWRDCSLRKWLNGYFFEHSFSSKEKEYIFEQRNKNDGNYESGVGGTEDTVDKVFLLSESEASNFFEDDDKRKALGTEYANEQYMVENNIGVRWWLRSSGYYDYRAAVVDENGKIDVDGFSTNRNCVAVRPAIWIKYK